MIAQPILGGGWVENGGHQPLADEIYSGDHGQIGSVLVSAMVSHRVMSDGLICSPKYTPRDTLVDCPGSIHFRVLEN